MPPIDSSHKSHNASDKYPTMHHFITEMCTHLVTKWCIVGFGTGALWDLWGGSIPCKQSHSDARITFVAMCRIGTGYQNGDCVLMMLSGGNEANESQVKFFKETINALQMSVILLRTCYLIDTRKCGNCHNATMKWIDISTCLLMELCWLFAISRHREIESLLVSFETWMCGLTNCCKPLGILTTINWSNLWSYFRLNASLICTISISQRVTTNRINVLSRVPTPWKKHRPVKRHWSRDKWPPFCRRHFLRISLN